MNIKTIFNMIELFKENIDKTDLLHQNKQINSLINELKKLEQSNNDLLLESYKNQVNLKAGDIIKIDNNVHDNKNLIYIKDLLFEVPSFPSKTKEKVLVLETIDLSNPSTYYFNARDNKIPLKNFEFSKIKNIELVHNIDYDIIKSFFENNAKLNQIIISRSIFDSSKNEFILANTNDYVKKGYTLVHSIDGINLLKNNVVSIYGKINDIDKFSNSYRELYLKLNNLKLETLREKDIIYKTNEYDQLLKNINDNLIGDIEKLIEINDIQNNLSEKIFDTNQLECELNR